MKYKELFRENLNGDKLEIILSLSCYNGDFKYNKDIPCEYEYILLKTATSPMKVNQYTGEVFEINGDRARVIVKIGDQTIDLYDIKLLDKVSEMDRVILSEHLNVDGRIEWIATRRPLDTGDLNFLTIALKNRDGDFVYKKRIDVITGETREELTNDIN